MGGEWSGWLREFPSREAVEAHVAAHPRPSWAAPWMQGAPWLRLHDELSLLYLAVVDGRVVVRHTNCAEWFELEFGRVGLWRPVTHTGTAT